MEKQQYEVREMEKDDIPQFIELLKVCKLYYSEDDTPEKFSRKLDIDKGLMFVAVIEERVIGAIMASYDGWAAVVWHFGVLPEFRGRRVHKDLWDYLRKSLLKKGADIIYGLVDERNVKMLKVLPRFGVSLDLKVVIVSKSIKSSLLR